mmetsp:Transcript_16163/g.18723  ORF Transcript_16163/g.18723 Transcript_16163/m.18723 type:complete len:143 (-) Transcript_16163:455-883(-)
MIVNLSVDNEIIPVKHTILCYFTDSVFALQLTDTKWTSEHTFKLDNGTSAVLIEHSKRFIMPIINQLRLAAMNELNCNDCNLARMKMNSQQDDKVLQFVVSKLFPNNVNAILGLSPFFIQSDLKMDISLKFMNQRRAIQQYT